MMFLINVLFCFQLVSSLLVYSFFRFAKPYKIKNVEGAMLKGKVFLTEELEIAHLESFKGRLTTYLAVPLVLTTLIILILNTIRGKKYGE